MQLMYATMPWAPPASDSQFPAWEHEGFWMQCYPMPYPPHFQGEGNSRGPVFDRLQQPIHSRLGQHQSGQGQNSEPVRPVYYDWSNWSQQRPAQVRPQCQEYRIKEKKGEPEPMQMDSGKAPVADVVQVGDGKSKIKDAQKGPMIIEKLVDPSQKLVLANDHEASSSNSKDQDKEKYFQPRWCPLGLTHTQKRRLQHLCRQEQKEKEAEKLRDEHFEKYRPMIPQGKVWQIMAVD